MRLFLLVAASLVLAACSSSRYIEAKSKGEGTAVFSVDEIRDGEAYPLVTPRHVSGQYEAVARTIKPYLEVHGGVVGQTAAASGEEEGAFVWVPSRTFSSYGPGCAPQAATPPPPPPPQWSEPYCPPPAQAPVCFTPAVPSVPTPAAAPATTCVPAAAALFPVPADCVRRPVYKSPCADGGVPQALQDAATATIGLPIHFGSCVLGFFECLFGL